MGLYSFVLFAAIVLLACVGSASKVAAANSTAQVRGEVEKQNEASTKSFAKTSEPTDEGDEARGFMDLTRISRAFESAGAQSWTKLEKADTDIHETPNFNEDVLPFLERPSPEYLSELLSARSRMYTNSKDPRISLLLETENEGIMARYLYSASVCGLGKKMEYAKVLLAQQFNFWLVRETSIEDIFVLVKKGQADYEVFNNQNWNVLKSFIEVYNKQNVPITLVDAYVKGFGDETKLLKALMEARRYQLATENALHFEYLLLTKWLNENVHPKTVLQWLEMDQKTEVIATYAIDIAVKYVDRFNEKNPGQEFSLIDALVASQDDVVVLRSLRMLSYSSDVKINPELLMDKQIERWIKDHKSADDVFTILGIKEDGLEHLDVNKIGMLNQFIHEKKFGELSDLFSVLLNGYGDEKLFMDVFASLTDYEHQVFNEIFSQWLLQYEPKEIRDKLKAALPNYTQAVEHIVDLYKTYVGANMKKEMSRYVIHQIEPRRT